MGAVKQYQDQEVRDLLRDRKIMHPPVTCHNRTMYVSMELLTKGDPKKIEQILRENGFWGEHTCR